MCVSGPSLLGTSEASVTVLAPRQAEWLWGPLPAAAAEAGVTSVVGVGWRGHVEGAWGMCARAPVWCREVKGGFSSMKCTQGHMAEQPENARCACASSSCAVTMETGAPSVMRGFYFPSEELARVTEQLLRHRKEASLEGEPLVISNLFFLDSSQKAFSFSTPGSYLSKDLGEQTMITVTFTQMVPVLHILCPPSALVIGLWSISLTLKMRGPRLLENTVFFQSPRSHERLPRLEPEPRSV